MRFASSEELVAAIDEVVSGYRKLPPAERDKALDAAIEKLKHLGDTPGYALRRLKGR
jgi:hypothetical protein